MTTSTAAHPTYPCATPLPGAASLATRMTGRAPCPGSPRYHFNLHEFPISRHRTAQTTMSSSFWALEPEKARRCMRCGCCLPCFLLSQGALCLYVSIMSCRQIRFRGWVCCLISNTDLYSSSHAGRCQEDPRPQLDPTCALLARGRVCPQLSAALAHQRTPHPLILRCLQFEAPFCSFGMGCCMVGLPDSDWGGCASDKGSLNMQAGRLSLMRVSRLGGQLVGDSGITFFDGMETASLGATEMPQE